MLRKKRPAWKCVRLHASDVQTKRVCYTTCFQFLREQRFVGEMEAVGGGMGTFTSHLCRCLSSAPASSASIRAPALMATASAASTSATAGATIVVPTPPPRTAAPTASVSRPTTGHTAHCFKGFCRTLLYCHPIRTKHAQGSRKYGAAGAILILSIVHNIP